MVKWLQKLRYDGGGDGGGGQGGCRLVVSQSDRGGEGLPASGSRGKGRGGGGLPASGSRGGSQPMAEGKVHRFVQEKEEERRRKAEQERQKAEEERRRKEEPGKRMAGAW